MWPITALAKRKIRLVTPPVFIRFAARMKKGIASSVKPVVEAYIRCGSIVSSDIVPQADEEQDRGQSHGDGDGNVQDDEHQQDGKDEIMSAFVAP